MDLDKITKLLRSEIKVDREVALLVLYESKVPIEGTLLRLLYTEVPADEVGRYCDFLYKKRPVWDHLQSRKSADFNWDEFLGAKWK